MAENISLPAGALAISPFFAAIQEMLGASAPSLNIVVLNGTTIKVACSALDGQQTASIEGRYRYRTTDLTAAHPGGASGTHNIFITASDNSFSGSPTVDATVYDFGLTILTSGSPGTALYRKVGEVDWDGTKIIGIRQLAGNRRDDAPLVPTAPIAGLTPVRVRGAASQSAALQTWETSGGTTLAKVNADGTIEGPAGFVLAVQADLVAESAARVAADSTESTARATADTAESTARIAGDTNNPSSGQKSALAGTSGTPGSGNKYVTDGDSRNTDARTPMAHVTSHESGGSDALVTAWTAIPRSAGVGGSAQYRKELGDVIRLQGQLSNGTGGAVTFGSTVATLPAGFRPSTGREVAVVSIAPGGQDAQWVTIGTGGQIVIGSGFGGGAGWAVSSDIWLDGVSFPI